MKAKAMIEEMKRIGDNRISVTFSVSMNDFHLKLINKNDKKTTHEKKEFYSFVITILPHKFNMIPDDALGECMEVYEHNPSPLVLPFSQQKQWCVAALTNQIINHLFDATLLKPFSFADEFMDEDIDSDTDFCLSDEGVSSMGTLREKLQDVENTVRRLIGVMDQLLLVSAISKEHHKEKEM